MASENHDIKKGRYLTAGALILWILLFIISYNVRTHDIERAVMSSALNETRTIFNDDVLYRSWVMREGGVYVLESDYTKPNPDLNVPDRDLRTKDGKKLTLVNPAYMTRLVHELRKNIDGIREHMTSLKPLRPANNPEAWEAAALTSFEKGKKEYYTLVNVNGQTVLRYMAPLITEKSCLNCHAQQGYKIGDVRGGISISLSYRKYSAIAAKQKRTVLIFHLIVGFIGICGIFITGLSSEKFKRRLFIEAEKLKESEERHRLLADNSSDVIWTTDLNGKINYISPSVKKQRGYTSEEVISQPLDKHFTSESLKAYEGWFQKIRTDIAEGKRVEENSLELEQPCKQGGTVWTEVTVSGIYNTGGECIGILCAGRDITKRRQLQRSIERSENKFRLLFELSPVGMALVDYETGDFIECNKALTTMTGYTSEELLKIDFWKITPEKYKAQEMEQLEELRQNGRFGPNEKEYIHKNGTLISIKISGFNLKQLDGRTVTWGIIEDISERKRWEKDLIESKERYDQLAEQSGTITWETDENGLYTYVSPVVENILGYKPEELVGKKHFWDILKPELRDSYKTKGLNFINSNKRIVNFENPLISKNGKTIWVLSAGMAIADKHGKVAGYRGSDRDITVLKEAEEKLKSYNEELEKINEELAYSREQVEESLYEKNILIENLEEAKIKLEEANKQKDKFFSIIAHDLRSPFQGLLGLTHIILEDIYELNVEEIKNYTELLKDSAESIYKLLENLLEWSILQRDIVQVRPEALSIGGVVNGILETQIPNARSKEISIDNNISGGIEVYADPNMLNTILRNLISNAIKFTRKQGSVYLDAAEKGDFIEISVRDSGIGIPEEMLNKLFSAGEKTSRPGTMGERSTGLGLLLCKEYIEKQNGEIRVESKVNEGTTFYFTLPKRGEV